MTPTREERARVLAGVAWQSQTRPTMSDFDFFRDGFVDGYTWEDAEVERLREAARKRLTKGHNDTCQHVLIESGEYPCNCGHDDLKVALAQPSHGEGSAPASCPNGCGSGYVNAACPEHGNQHRRQP